MEAKTRSEPEGVRRTVKEYRALVKAIFQGKSEWVK
jgi:hypothetical protein